jgi:hypothetical protein
MQDSMRKIEDMYEIGASKLYGEAIYGTLVAIYDYEGTRKTD